MRFAADGGNASSGTSTAQKPPRSREKFDDIAAFANALRGLRGVVNERVREVMGSFDLLNLISSQAAEAISGQTWATEFPSARAPQTPNEIAVAAWGEHRTGHAASLSG